MSSCHDCGSSSSAAVLTPLIGISPAPRTVAIVGPPNAGKSTLFNRLTGLRQKVANFPGVTVEQRVGRAKLVGSGQVDLVDLPGIYSLHPRSEDERVTHDVLHGQMPGVQRPTAVLLILDSTNLGRHLVLAASILSLGLPTLVVLNMEDDLRARGGRVDTDALSQRLGAPVVLISAAKGKGVEKVFEFLSSSVVLPKPIELPVLQDIPECREWATRVNSQSGYAAPGPPRWTRRLDALFLHRVAGPVIFFVVVMLVFQTMFTWAKPLMDGVQAGIELSGAWIGSFLPDNWLRSLVVDGVWGGVGSVLVFLPQILLLFLFLGILEDSGYLARAALIADRSMSRAGLQGKSFIPLLSACACAVPAIMSTRTIENRRDRIATILIAPFMTCSARLNVYALLIAAFVPDRPLLGKLLGLRAVTLLGLYVLGFVAAVGTALLLRSSVLKRESTPFVLEMPAYRWPTFRSLGLRLVDRAKIFLRRAGTVILGVAMVLWLLAHVPLHDGKAPPIEQSAVGKIGHAIEPVIKPLGFNWKIGVGLLTSLAAREVIVGTLGTIYGIEDQDQSPPPGLQAALKQDLNLAGAVALMIFFAFALQCMSTIAVVRRETGGWTWPIAQFSYMTIVAWTCSFAAYRLLLPFS